jgi:hypothetical protein
VTARVRVRVSRLFALFGTIEVQLIRLTDVGPAALRGPLWLVLRGLPRGVRLITCTGHTHRDAPLGSPCQRVPVRRLRPHRTVTLLLVFSIPTGDPLSYDPQLLEGPGPV